MNNGSPNNKHQELIGELRRRFPLFEQVRGRFGTDMEEERVPWFFALLLSAALEGKPGACCFVLDKSPNTTAIAAIFLALHKLQKEFPELAKTYTQSALHQGQLVRVKPSNHVYEYGGIWEEDYFRLKLQGIEDCRTFPVTDLLRLEPTDRVRPKGKLNSPLGTFECSLLDKLLDIRTCGNNSLIRNTVLLFMAKTQFAKTANAVTLMSEHADESGRLSDFLPWGSITQFGTLEPNDTHQVTGEPIIAVTKVPEDLATAAAAAKDATKIVLADGACSLARDLQAYDAITEHQKVVVLASSEETNALGILRDRGCPVWYMSPDEILIGEACAEDRVRKSLVGATIRAADTRQRVQTTAVKCEDRALQEVAASLDQVAKMVGNGEEARESNEILARLYGILLDYSECCFGVGDETKTNLQETRNKIKQDEKWLEHGVVKKLEEASSKLEAITDNEAYGQEKVEALLGFTKDKQDGSWAVVTRSPRTVESLRTGLGNKGVNVPVLSVSEIDPSNDYAGIIVPAWPKRHRFNQVWIRAVTPNIRVLAYPFEAKWLSVHQAHEGTLEQSNWMEAETRSSVLGIEPRFLTSLNHRRGADPPSHEPEPEPLIFEVEDRVTRGHATRPAVATEGEDSREAQLVQFFGNCHALLTVRAKLPLLNQLIDRAGTGKTKLRTVTASQLSPRDFVLFRDSGDKEFIRLIAEDELGEKVYERLRGVAERWKSSLRLLGTSAIGIRRRLAEHGLRRDTETIRGWLGNPHHIGPRDFSDIEFIAKATKDVELLSMREEIEGAITKIRNTHISAGNQLTQLLLEELDGQLKQLNEQPSQLDLGYGKAWCVRVEMVDPEQHRYPSNQVNRLLWGEDTEF